MTTLVLTVVGTDRVGLVKALADIVSDHGGSWQRSQLAELAGTFAGVVVVTVPDQQSETLQAALRPLDGLEISVRRADPDQAPTTPRRRFGLELLGNDRPGIVAAVSGVLAQHGLGVTELETVTREAPMAGGMLFEAAAVVSADPETSLDAVQASLEALASEILVTFSVAELD